MRLKPGQHDFDAQILNNNVYGPGLADADPGFEKWPIDAMHEEVDGEDTPPDLQRMGSNNAQPPTDTDDFNVDDYLNWDD